MAIVNHNEGDVLNNLYAGPLHPSSSSLFQLFNNLTHHLSSRSYYPRFDIEEHQYSYEIYGDLPGVDQDSLEIATLDEHTLEISGSTDRQIPDEAEASGTGEKSSAQNGVTHADSVPITQHKTSAPPTPAATAAPAEDLETEEGVAKSKARRAAEIIDTCDGGELTKTHCMHRKGGPQSAGEMKPRYLTRERQSGTFHRFFSFINSIIEKEVTATFHNGVLHVSVPKGPASQKNHIEIRSGSVAKS